MTMIGFTDAVGQALIEDDHPVVTDYDIYRVADRLFGQGSWKGVAIKRAPQIWDVPKLRKLIRRLNLNRTLAPDADFNSGVWRVVQSTRSGSAEEIACIADPFCYVSHLSAMQRYGLTDRSPESLHLSTPTRSLWNEMRDARVEKDLGSDDTDGATLLLHYRFSGTLRRRSVMVHETSRPAAPVGVRGEKTRITSIGRTFVDMLSEPEICGGMRHVLDVWEASAAEWLDAIVRAVDASQSKIDKVRAGYILTERLNLNDDRIENWRAFAQRGGSRKLDPNAPYAPVFSEAWMISINV